MPIRTRISLLYTLLTAIILLAFGLVIYYSAAKNRENEFYELLRKEALTKAGVFFEAQIEPEVLQNIYRSNREIINEVEVAIYSQQAELVYHDAVDIDYVKETTEMLEEIFANNFIRFFEGDWQVIGLKYLHEDTAFAITAASYDEYGFSKLANLRQTLILLFIISLVVIYPTGRYLSKKAFDPILEITEQARKIGAENLDLRVKQSNGRDELTQLAGTFNQMLDRLEKSFAGQKEFVSHISHELRTPLAAIMAEVQFHLEKDRNPEETTRALERIKEDAQKINRLSSGLLDLARAGYDPSQIHFEKVAVDEVLVQARASLVRSLPHFKIDLNLEPLNETAPLPEIAGNPYLLGVAFRNLMENACKYSSPPACKVELRYGSSGCEILFTDEGPGIHPKDLPHLFDPFFRGSEQPVQTGHGIGLYLTKRIMDLHKGRIEVESGASGTCFRLTF
jgi:signal transduction histidine kinase